MKTYTDTYPDTLVDYLGVKFSLLHGFFDMVAGCDKADNAEIAQIGRAIVYQAEHETMEILEFIETHIGRIDFEKTSANVPGLKPDRIVSATLVPAKESGVSHGE
jgi:hypothetical protein